MVVEEMGHQWARGGVIEVRFLETSSRPVGKLGVRCAPLGALGGGLSGKARPPEPVLEPRSANTCVRLSGVARRV